MEEHIIQLLEYEYERERNSSNKIDKILANTIIKNLCKRDNLLPKMHFERSSDANTKMYFTRYTPNYVE